MKTLQNIIAYLLIMGELLKFLLIDYKQEKRIEKLEKSVQYTKEGITDFYLYRERNKDLWLHK